MSGFVEFARPDGKTIKGYLVEPDRGDSAPGVVVVQEWWGIDDTVKAAAERLAGAGYRALVPDLYRGKTTLDANEAEHLMNDLDFADAASQDIRGAVSYLKDSGSERVGVTGFCMGGALTLLSSVFVPELDAAVIWYGYPPLEFIDPDKIKVPLMGHWGTNDDVFAITGVDELERMLAGAGVDYTFHRYDAKHAFANDTADEKNLPFLRYDAAAAELAWQRTIDFLHQQLG